ncbi:MAG: putative ABC transporter permease [Lachnospiraceae bacterium]|nr:putative ABC transporter permease [Lachnospiraceae bacterium]
MEWFENVFLSFFIYSFIGWIWESFFYSLWDKHKLVNRGFMFGPYIPIYGVGALIDLVFLGGIKNMILLFFVSGIVCCAVEYLTGYVMEKLFHARWWDYTDMLWHLNGRICIEGFFAFGLLSVALVGWIHPFTTGVLDMIPAIPKLIATIATVTLFATDLIISVKHAADFDKKIRKIAESLGKLKDRMAALYDTVVVETFFRKVIEHLTDQQKRLVYAFPKMRSVSYPGVVRAIRRALPGGTGTFFRRRKHGRADDEISEDITAAPAAEMTEEELAAAEKAIAELAAEHEREQQQSAR